MFRILHLSKKFDNLIFTYNFRQQRFLLRTGNVFKKNLFAMQYLLKVKFYGVHTAVNNVFRKILLCAIDKVRA